MVVVRENVENEYSEIGGRIGGLEHLLGTWVRIFGVRGPDVVSAPPTPGPGAVRRGPAAHPDR
jgi:hypothetical protein